VKEYAKKQSTEKNTKMNFKYVGFYYASPYPAGKIAEKAVCRSTPSLFFGHFSHWVIMALFFTSWRDKVQRVVINFSMRV